MLRIEILPVGGKSCSLVQKRLLGNAVGTMTLNCVQHDHRIGDTLAQGPPRLTCAYKWHTAPSGGSSLRQRQIA